MVLANAHLYGAGDTGRSIDAATRAIELTPSGPFAPFYVGLLAAAHYMAGHYTDAADAAQRAIRLYRDYEFGHVIRTAGLGQLGRADDALAELRRLEQIEPGFGPHSIIQPFRPDQREHLLDGLRKAGMKG